MLSRLITLSVTAVLTAGCYECNADTCKDGCCSAQGVCIVAPTNDLECGLGGVLCQNCTARPGFGCIQNICQSKCGTANCLGCCTETGTCVAPTSQSDTACGDRGSVCTSCGVNRTCERLTPTVAGKCCGRASKTCMVSYDCCSGLTCRPAGTGGLTCQ